MTQHGAEQLVVRQHERHLCRLDCRLRLDDHSVAQVTPARTVGDGAGGLSAMMVDCSRGGLGLESPVFLPRGSRVRVSVAPGQPGAPRTELLVRVQRVSMMDRKPTYYLGVSFLGTGNEHEYAVEAAVSLAKAASSGATAPGKEAA